MGGDAAAGVSGPGKNAGSHRDRLGQIVKLITQIIVLLAAIVGLATGYVEHDGKKQAEEQASQQKTANEDLPQANQDLQKKYSDLEMRALPRSWAVTTDTSPI